MKARTVFILLLVLACAMAAQERKALSVGGQLRISGTVINDGNEQPLAGTHVTVKAAQGGTAQTMTTGENGAFAFDHLRAGKYTLSAERRGFASQQYQQHEGRFSTAIVVGPNLDSSNIVFRVMPDASFSGRITDEQGDPARNARVMLIREQSVEGVLEKAIVANTGADDQGYYHFAHLKPGAYYIAVSARPWFADNPFTGRTSFADDAGGGFGGGRTFGAASNSALDLAYPLTLYPDVTDSAAARPITLRAGDRAAADITLRALQALHLRIKSNLPRPENEQGPRQFMGAMPTEIIFGDIEVPVQTAMHGDGNGTMVMSVAPGHYVLHVTPSVRRFRGEAGPANEEDQEPEPSRVHEVELVSDMEVDASEIPSSTSVSGVVKSADGKLLPKPLQVQLRSSHSLRRTLVARASEKGEFTFTRGVPAGRYEISMNGGEDTFIQRVSATGAKVTGRTVEITGSEVHLSVIAGSGMARLDGVVMRDGKPQSGVMILLAPNDPANNRPLFRRDQSDSDGSFTLSDVVPGRYTLLALEKGWDLSWSDAEALKPFLAGGETLVVQRKGEYNVHVNVQ